MAKKRVVSNPDTLRRAPRAAGPAPQVPRWLPPVVFALATVLLFREFFLSGTSMLGTDSIALSYFARNFYTEFVQNFGRMPYWNPLLYGGLPFVEGMHGDIFYPPSIAMFFLDARAMWGWKMSLHIFAAGAFTYLWLRRGLQLDRLPAMFGGLVYMMGADLVSLVLPGGDGKLFVSTLAPLLFWLTERAAARGRLLDFALFSLGIALIVFTSHMQAAYYCVWGVSLYFLFRVTQLRRAGLAGVGAARMVGLFALAGVLGVGAAAVQFLPPLNYLQEFSHRADRAAEGERGYEWSSTYSLNAEEIVALAVPEFVGELTQTSRTRVPGGYWGRNPLKLNSEYAGLIPLLLIPVLLLRRRTGQVWFFVALALLTLLCALASSTPLGRLFYLIPGVSLFRSWSIIIFLYGLSIATLGAIGAQQLQDWLRTDAAPESVLTRQTLWIGTAVLALLAVLASTGILTSAWTAIFRPDLDAAAASRLAANAEYIQRGFWIAFAFAAALAGLWEMASRRVFSARAFVLLLTVLAAVDLYRVSRPFVAHTAGMNEPLTSATLFQPDDVIAYLQRQQEAGGVFRVLDLSSLFGARPYDANDFAIHGIEQLAGHHGNEIGRYRNLIGGEAPTNLGQDLRLADVTNTEYLIIPGQLDHPSLEPVHTGTNAMIYRNRNVLPRAYIVGSTEVLAGDSAVGRMIDASFDARTTALIEAPLPADVEVQQGATGVVEWLDRDVDEYTLRVAPDRPALLVVLDNWYPAWEATVDGHRVDILRVNYTFRGIAVPPGEHTVTFRYNPSSLRTGAIISLIILGLLLVVVAAGSVEHYRAARRAPPAPAAP